MSAGYDYSRYTNYIKRIFEGKEQLESFKQHPEYQEILEHVSYFQGIEYLQHIWNRFQLNDEDVHSFCARNDMFGSPIKHQYSPSLFCSPTSLRYIFHSNLILSHMQKLGLQTVSIVEVGCGYGGLLLAIDHFASRYNITIKNYSCVDLPEPLLLQNAYISNHSVAFPVTFHDARYFGKDVKGDDLFFVSMYCFSEISSAFQTEYRNILLPKCTHGWIAWNMIDVYDIGKRITVEEEVPNTGSKNKFVFF